MEFSAAEMVRFGALVDLCMFMLHQNHAHGKFSKFHDRLAKLQRHTVYLLALVPDNMVNASCVANLQQAVLTMIKIVASLQLGGPGGSLSMERHFQRLVVPSPKDPLPWSVKLSELVDFRGVRPKVMQAMSDCAGLLLDCEWYAVEAEDCGMAWLVPILERTMTILQDIELCYLGLQKQGHGGRGQHGGKADWKVVG